MAASYLAVDRTPRKLGGASQCRGNSQLAAKGFKGEALSSQASSARDS